MCSSDLASLEGFELDLEQLEPLLLHLIVDYVNKEKVRLMTGRSTISVVKRDPIYLDEILEEEATGSFPAQYMLQWMASSNISPVQDLDDRPPPPPPNKKLRRVKGKRILQGLLSL